MDREDMIERYARFLREYVDDSGNEVYLNKLKDLLTVTPKRSLAIDWTHLNSFDPELAGELLENPEESILAAEDAIQIVLREPPLLKEEEFKVHARFYNLPRTLLVKELGSEHINRLIQVEGIITRVSEVKPFVQKAVFVCKDCGNEMIRLQRPYENLVKPAKCDACGSRNVDLDVEKSRFINFQSFRLQDRPESLKGGQMPRFVDAILLDDMVDTALPGDRVLATGILRVILEQKDKRPIFKKVLEVNHIEQLSKEIEELEISPEDEQKIRELAKRKDIVDAIVDSIAPAIWGHKTVKKGIALALFGGVQRVLPDGTKLRGESHVLLVGDPGVAKSQLLRYVANLAPRAIYTSGKSSSAAGLTAAAVRDEFTGSWVLEAGVLVLADGGFACLHPDSRVLVDGKYRRIEDLFELEKSYKALSDDQIVDIQEKEMEVTALDLGSIRTKTSKATIIRRKPWKGELLRLKFRSGNEVTLTPDHLLIDGQTLEWKEAERFNVGESVIGLDKNFNPRPDEIVSIERVPYEGYVYDLYVPGEHNFLAEGIIVHNCIDEFDKMSDRDRSAIHEALEQQSYHHDFELLLANGRKVKIGELVDSLIEANRDKVIIGNDTEILPVEDIKLLAYDIERKEIVKVKADRVSRHRAPDRFIRLRFSNGREITVTPEHPIMVWENGEITEKPAGEVMRGDVVIGVASYPMELSPVEGNEFKNRGDAEARADYLYSTGKVARVKRLTGRYLVEAAERTFPRDIVAHLKAAAKILGVRQLPSERQKLARSLVPEGIVRSYLERVTERMEAIRHLANENLGEALGLIPGRRIYESSGMTPEHLRRKAESGEPWALSAAKRVIEDVLFNAEKYLRRFMAYWNGNINFLRVIKVEEVPNDRWEWVYDVTVEPYHLFVSHGLVLHNTISISKAGITATLNARTTVIAAANPKYGRFNRHKSLPEQLDLPPTLLSRFDLIFLLLDEPDEKVDASIAEHILKVRRGEAEAVTPKIPYDLLKKYIAYARKNVHPVLSREAMEEIKRYYVRMRKGFKRPGEDDGVQPIPITARQLEALIRLSEAHARMRLSETVTREDARAAIAIIEDMIRKIAVDEEGTLDVSILEVGKSSKKINKIDRMVDIIKSLESEGEFGAPEDRIIEAAKQAGLGSENEIKKLINDLKRDARIYEPRAGFYRVL
ncbi:DNA replication licensing factor [Thermococcus sp. 21S7]|uniref:DNA replication licensing factor n=1 Tax=Thermococcus sp. 21S7 TaxID=1638221 RepID=UPI00143A1714|nr:DNA replication licensing factor [Thermococcus sp. 21S7]NJE61604.1 DNA replication licensing factor [Thermococcus sp. 21S7]